MPITLLCEGFEWVGAVGRLSSPNRTRTMTACGGVFEQWDLYLTGIKGDWAAVLLLRR